MNFIIIRSYKPECLKHPDRFTTDFGVKCSLYYHGLGHPALLVEAETEPFQAKEFFQSKNKKAAQQSRAMNTILVILSGNYVRT